MAGNQNSGRLRKPRALHERDGTFRADRQHAGEPQYPLEAPDKPAYVAAAPAASAEWDRIVPIMVQQRTMAKAYQTIVALHCLLVAAVAEGEGGYQAVRELRQIDAQLGFTPTSVGKVAAAPPAQAGRGPLAVILGRKGRQAAG